LYTSKNEDALLGNFAANAGLQRILPPYVDGR